MKKAQILEVIAGTPDKPLTFGDFEIPCYVLENEDRVVSQRGMTSGIGLNPGVGFRLPQLFSTKAMKPYISRMLQEQLENPVEFKNPVGGGNVHGYRAEILVEICETVRDASEKTGLGTKYLDIVRRCDVIYRALARVGVIALVDEATGYQQVRQQRALAAILERYLEQEFRPWTRTFPYEFYEQIYRLKGWGEPTSTERPSVIGHYTNNIVYSRLAPGVLNELRERNPMLKSGSRRSKHHQWFTADVGHVKLREHLQGVMALMRAASTWEQFKRNLTRAYPKLNEQYSFDGGKD